MAWNKSDLVAAVYNQLDLNRDEVEDTVDVVFDTLALALTCGEDVRICRFGKFELRDRQPTMRSNPKTGEPVAVPAKTAVAFKPSPVLKERVNR